MSPLPLGLISSGVATSSDLAWDSFDRANGAIGTADSGHVYSVQKGTWVIASNTAGCSADSTAATCVVDVGEADVLIQVKLLQGSSDYGLCWRQSDNNNGYAWTYSGTRIHKRVAESYTELAQWTGAPSAGSIIAVHAVGDVHTIYIDGVQKAQFTDSFNSSVTKHGLRVNGTGYYFDDLLIQEG